MAVECAEHSEAHHLAIDALRCAQHILRLFFRFGRHFRWLLMLLQEPFKLIRFLYNSVTLHMPEALNIKSFSPKE